MGKFLLKTQMSFEAAHRLYDVDTYSEECRNNIHGHSYKVNVYVTCDNLNDASMVVDFKLLKFILKSVVEDTFDHSCILVNTDPLCEAIEANCKKVHIVDNNPTAEWMAEHFFKCSNSALEESFSPNVYNVRVCKVEVQETENNIAIYEEG